MADKQAILAELERRGVLADPKKAAIVAELQRRGRLPSSKPPTGETTAAAGVERPGVETARVSAEKDVFDPKAARRLATALPIAGAVAAPMLLPAAATAGFGGAMLGAGTAAIGGATGEAGRQIVNAATGEPEKSSFDAAKKIAATGAEAAAGELGGRAALKTVQAGFQAIGDAGRVFLDFLANVRRGTAKTAGALGKEAFAEPLTVEAVRKYGQGVSDAIKDTQRVLGSELEAAIKEADKAAPEGVLPFHEVVQEYHKLNKSLRTQAAIPGASPTVQKAAAGLEDYLRGWLAKAGQRQNLTVQETKDLLDRVRDVIPFDATNPGASKAALKRLQPFEAFLRRQMPKGVDKSLQKYSELIDSADAIEQGLAIKGGERITPARVIEIENNLKKLLKENTVRRTVEQTELAKVGADPRLLQRGEGLAVQQELSQTAPAVSGEGGLVGLTSRVLRSATSPLTRALFLPASRGLEALQIGSERGLSTGVSSALVNALLRKQRGNDYEGVR